MLGVEWAHEMFGENRPVIISTHVNTGHVHNHIAVCPYDLDGKRWLANKKTLALGRQISDKIIKTQGLSVIENPRRKNTLSYAEWLAKNNGTSWKSKMADDIDRFIISQNVTDINSLIRKMKSEGYIFTDENKLIAKPTNIKYGCRFDRLGFGYSQEMLQLRIENKSLETVGRKISRCRGFQIDVAVCFKQTQYDFYRIKDSGSYKTSYAELKRSAELLTFICDNKIRSEKEFIDYVNYLDDREKELSKIIEYSSYGGIYNENAFEAVVKNREKNKLELDKIKAEKHIAAAHYKTYLASMESNYDRLLKQEKIKREIELYRQGYEISADGKPYKDFNETIDGWNYAIIRIQKQGGTFIMSSIQSFEEFYNQNSHADKDGNEQDTAKARAKYAEIAETVGVSTRLLKQSCEDADINQTGKIRWAIPEVSTEFIMWILDEYTSRDFKALRRANWYGVSLDITNKLIDGFCSMLSNLGYDPDVIDEQRLLMSHRLHYELRSKRSEVDTAISELSAKLDEYEHSFRMNKSDLSYFYGFVETKISNLTEYIDEIYDDFIDIRNAVPDFP